MFIWEWRAQTTLPFIAVSIFSGIRWFSNKKPKQVVSTSGIASTTENWTNRFRNSTSNFLHAVDDELRSELLQWIKRIISLRIIETVKKFPQILRKKVMFEYLVIKGKNDLMLLKINKLLMVLNKTN